MTILRSIGHVRTEETYRTPFFSHKDITLHLMVYLRNEKLNNENVVLTIFSQGLF
jgi:hypothetical protein